jgi:hypothetical protein
VRLNPSILSTKRATLFNRDYQKGARAAAARANGMKGGRPRKKGVIASKKKTKDV